MSASRVSSRRVLGASARVRTPLGAIGGPACKARGERYSAYENALGTGQVHMLFDLERGDGAP